jgi:hypothetical protein
VRSVEQIIFAVGDVHRGPGQRTEVFADMPIREILYRRGDENKNPYPGKNQEGDNRRQNYELKASPVQHG